MQTLTNYLFPTEALIMLGLILGAFGLGLMLLARAAAKAATGVNGKVVATEVGKIAGKTAGKIAWRMFKSRMGI